VSKAVFAAALGLSVFSGAAGAEPASSLEALILEAMPSPARCGATSEPFYFCRHNRSTPSLALEIGFTDEGPVVSLTHNDDDRAAHDYVAVVRRFFASIGVAEKVFDECAHYELWRPDGVLTPQFKLLCRRVEFMGRVTHEFFAFYRD